MSPGGTCLVVKFGQEVVAEGHKNEELLKVSELDARHLSLDVEPCMEHLALGKEGEGTVFEGARQVDAGNLEVRDIVSVGGLHEQPRIEFATLQVAGVELQRFRAIVAVHVDVREGGNVLA